MPVLRWDVEHLSRVENVLHRGGSREEWKLEQVRILHVNLKSKGKVGTNMKSKVKNTSELLVLHTPTRPVTSHHETGLLCLSHRKREQGYP